MICSPSPPTSLCLVKVDVFHGFLSDERYFQIEKYSLGELWKDHIDKNATNTMIFL